MIYPWQTDLWADLNKRLQGGRVPHAMIIQAQPGMGEGMFAQLWAQHLLCEKPTDQPCGQCQSCRWFIAKTHPDFYRLHPPEGKRVIAVDAVRTLCASLTQTSQRNARVVVIESADYLNIAAANCLLKTLEEPQAHIYFILLTAGLDHLLPTMISRCQCYSLNADAQSSASWLASQGVPDIDVPVLLAAAHNAPLLALDLASRDYVSWRRLLCDDLQALWSGTQSVVDIAEKWKDHQLDLLLDTVFLLCLQMVKQSRGVFADEVAGFRHQATTAACFTVLSYLQDARRQLRASANPRLLLEHLLIQCRLLGVRA